MRAGVKVRLKSGVAWAVHHLGFFLLIRFLHHRLYGPGVRILFYHRVEAFSAETDLLGRCPLTAREFEKHLSHLCRFYHVVSLEQAQEILASGRPVPPNLVAITFDDGYRNNYTVAMPLLRKYGVTATVFVVSSAIDGEPLWFDQIFSWFANTTVPALRFSKVDSELNLTCLAGRRGALRRVLSVMKSLPNRERIEAMSELRDKLEVPLPDCELEDKAMLKWDELRDMAQSRLITIGAHTVTHPILTHLDDNEIRTEIEDSCRRIAQELGRPVRFFAYPNGDYNSTAQSAVRGCGLVGCATQGNGFNPPGTDLTVLRRLGAEGLPMFRFALYLAGWKDLQTRLLETFKQLRRNLESLAYAIIETVGILPLIRFLNRRQMTVLVYRGVCSGSSSHLDTQLVKLRSFRRQMRWIRRHFTPVSLEDAIVALKDRKPFPQRAVLVTFDGANRDSLHLAWPILKKLGIRPVVFVPVQSVGGQPNDWAEELEARMITTRSLGVSLNDEWLWLRTPQERQAAFGKIVAALKQLDPAERAHILSELELQLSPNSAETPPTFGPSLTWDELRKLVEQGCSVGSHTFSRGILPGRPAADIVRELEDSKRELESRLEAPVLAFSYPDGKWNPEVRQLVERAGYTCAFTSEPGRIDLRTDRFLLNRIATHGTDSMSAFIGAISGVRRLRKRQVAKVLEISNYPPPQCGWAMQTKLLAETLRRRGAVCEVMNINESRKIKSPEYLDVQNGIDYLLKVLMLTMRGYRPHTHVNAESPKGYLLALAANLTGRVIGQPAVMTFHGGLPQTYFPRDDSAFLRMAYRLLFMSAHSITCDSIEIEQAIRSYRINGKPITSVPCFSLQNLDFERRPLSAKVEAFLRERHPVFFCFLCFRPEYGLETVLAGMRKFTEQRPRAGFIWLGYPSKEAPPLEAFLDSQPLGRPENLLLAGNMDHDTFMTLLTRCFAYLRPHVRDGVSASVLESLALGVPVVAAENGMRPPGVITYNFDDAADLSEKLVYVVDNYEAIRSTTRSHGINDNIERVVDWLLHPPSGNEKLTYAHSAEN